MKKLILLLVCSGFIGILGSNSSWGGEKLVYEKGKINFLELSEGDKRRLVDSINRNIRKLQKLPYDNGNGVVQTKSYFSMDGIHRYEYFYKGVDRNQVSKKYKDELRNFLIRSVCTHKKLRSFLDGIAQAFEYKYFDEHGRLITIIYITESDCQENGY